MQTLPRRTTRFSDFSWLSPPSYGAETPPQRQWTLALSYLDAVKPTILLRRNSYCAAKKAEITKLCKLALLDFV
jgi:hypothetical protein